jgi:3-oxoadipate enol-lactonase
MGLSGMAALARRTPAQAQQWLTDQVYLQRKTEQWEAWAIHEASLHDWRMVLEAGREIGRYDAREWLEGVDVPTSVVITMRDRVVPVRRQVRLFETVQRAEAFRVDGDHDSVAAQPERFVPTLLRAVHSAVERSAGRP